MNTILFTPQEWGHPLLPGDPRSHHIAKVLRLNPKDRCRVACLGKGLGYAHVLAWEGEPGRSLLHLQWPDSLEPSPPSSGLHVILGQVRPLVMQRLFKDLASLGIESISIVEATLSEKSYGQASFWQDNGYIQFLMEGASQGGLAELPRVTRFQSLAPALRGQDTTNKSFVFHPGPHPLVIVDLPALPLDAGVTLAIGPERGWTQKEFELLLEAGFLPRSLGERIVRAELAASALALMFSMAIRSGEHHG